jgi:CheY-like chemotaxis protein
LAESRKVLIVDDNADQGRPLALILRYSGYEADFVTSGEEALSLVRQKQPDLMIVDLMMPGMNGFEVLRSLRTNPSTEQIPVVIYSACSDEQEIARARREGANEYWVKVSMRIEEIQRRIERYFPAGGAPAA